MSLRCEVLAQASRPLLERRPEVLRLSGLTEDAVAFLAASQAIGLLEAGASRGALLVRKSLAAFLLEKGIVPDARSAALWSLVAEAASGVCEGSPETDAVGFSEAEHPFAMRHELRLLEVWEANGAPRLPAIDAPKAGFWVVCGLAALASRISSQLELADGDGLSGSGRKEICEAVGRAADALGFCRPAVGAGLSFDGLFPGKTPRPFQSRFYDVVQSDGIYAIEEPMGAGKTEAGLFAAYKLLEAGWASGLYYGVPGGVPAAGLLDRLMDFARKVGLDPARVAVPSLGLGLQGGPGGTWPEAQDRSLFSAFGVGGLDELLFAALPVKDFASRLTALAGKVVILDGFCFDGLSRAAVDAGRVRRLCCELKKLGCTVIILSTALREGADCRLLGRDPELYSHPRAPYPRLMGDPAGKPLADVLLKQPASFEARIRRRKIPVVEAEAVNAARAGARVLWCCKTPEAVAEKFLHLKTLLPADERRLCLGLLHERFPVFASETLERRWGACFAGGKREGCGVVLVASDAVLPGLDFDADLVIGEPANGIPEVLLERLGKLWRHREAVGARPREVPEYLVPFDPFSWGPARKDWNRADAVVVPGGIRNQMAAVYSDPDDANCWEYVDLDCCAEEMYEEGDDSVGPYYREYWASLHVLAVDGWREILPEAEAREKAGLGGRSEAVLALATAWREDEGIAVLLEDGAPIKLGNEGAGALERLARSCVRLPAGEVELAADGWARERLCGVADGLLILGADGELLPGPGVSELKIKMRWDPELGVVAED